MMSLFSVSNRMEHDSEQHPLCIEYNLNLPVPFRTVFALKTEWPLKFHGLFRRHCVKLTSLVVCARVACERFLPEGQGDGRSFVLEYTLVLTKTKLQLQQTRYAYKMLYILLKREMTFNQSPQWWVHQHHHHQQRRRLPCRACHLRAYRQACLLHQQLRPCSGEWA